MAPPRRRLRRGPPVGVPRDKRRVTFWTFWNSSYVFQKRLQNVGVAPLGRRVKRVPPVAAAPAPDHPRIGAAFAQQVRRRARVTKLRGADQGGGDGVAFAFKPIRVQTVQSVYELGDARDAPVPRGGRQRRVPRPRGFRRGGDERMRVESRSQPGEVADPRGTPHVLPAVVLDAPVVLVAPQRRVHHQRATVEFVRQTSEGFARR